MLSDIVAGTGSTVSGTGMTQYTIAQVRAKTAGQLSGTFTITDSGRQGLFYVDATDTTTTDDNGVVFVTAGGQRVKRIYSGAVDLAWFGLVNDDVDLASSTNQGAIIDTVLQANRYGNYYIGKGTYWLDGKTEGAGGSITIPNNINLYLHQECILKVRTSSNSNDILFQIAGVENVTITGGQLVGARYHNSYRNASGGESEYGMGLNIDYARNITIRDMYITDFHGDGIYVAGHQSQFLNPTVPVSQLMLGTTTAGNNTGVQAGLWRIDVIGTGSVSFTLEGDVTPFATVTEFNSGFYQTPHTTGYRKIQATINGNITEVRFDRPTYDMLIDNIKVNNCRRNGISLICVVNWTISNALLYNTNGTLPQAGIDLEPNNATERIWHGRLINVDSFDNLTQGFQITGHNIVMDNCNAYRNGDEGFYLADANDAGGDYTMNNCSAFDNGTGLQGQGGRKLIINNFNIKNCNLEYGMQIAGVTEAIIDNVFIENCVGYGITIPGNVTRSIFSNIFMKDVSKGGTQPAINALASNCTFDNVNIKGSGHAGIQTSSSATNIKITGGQIEECNRSGVLLNSSDSSVDGVKAMNNNTANSSSYHNIEVVGDDNRITNNIIKKGTNNPRYGIKVQSGANNTIILNNDVAGGGSLGNIDDLGTNTVYSLALQGRKVVANTNYTQIASDDYIAFTSLSAARTFTLLPASQWKGKVITIKDESGNAGTYNISLVGTIEGSSSRSINTNYGAIKLYSNGTTILIMP